MKFRGHISATVLLKESLLTRLALCGIISVMNTLSGVGGEKDAWQKNLVSSFYDTVCTVFCRVRLRNFQLFFARRDVEGEMRHKHVHPPYRASQRVSLSVRFSDFVGTRLYRVCCSGGTHVSLALMRLGLDSIASVGSGGTSSTQSFYHVQLG